VVLIFGTMVNILQTRGCTEMIENPVFRSKRLFQVWRYTVSHRQLLLRSNKVSPETRRIEILFKDVSFMQIGPSFRGLEITICDPHAISDLKTLNLEIGTRSLYLLRGEGFRGFIAAGSMTVHEDEREHNEPSALLALPAL
jgi:hypothetical protein